MRIAASAAHPGRVLNAAGTLTRLGGALMSEAVKAAMLEGASRSFDMWELQAAASRQIASATDAEAGLVTTGASAALTLAAAACLAGLDPLRMDRLPETIDGRDEIVMPRTHRNAYDRAFRIAGARIIDAGTNDRGTGAGVRGLEAWELDAVISARTAALAANAAVPEDMEVILAAGQRRDLPVIVDAAAQLPPYDNLSHFIKRGAALVCFSGGKAIGGPQATGILAGRRDLIASAALQMLDMDVRPSAFAPPAEFFPAGAPKDIPRHGIGRGFKAAKESILGLLAALNEFSEDSLVRRESAVRKRLASIQAALQRSNVFALRIDEPDEAGRLPRLVLSLGAGNALQASGLAARLRLRKIPVFLAEAQIARGELIADLIALAPDDDALLIEALSEAAAEKLR